MSNVEPYVTYDQLLLEFPFLPTSRAGRFGLIKKRNFPPARYIGANTPVWRISEIYTWIETRPRSHKAVRLEARDV